MRRKKANTVGVLLSGGLDSAALVGWFLDRGFEVHPIYIRAGLRWERAELFWTRKFLKRIRNSKLKNLAVLPLNLARAYDSNWSRRGQTPGPKSSDKAVFLPARNLLLITTALLHLYPKNITSLAMATLKGNPFRDGRPAYFKSMEKVLTESFSKPIRIFTPFRGMKKKEVIRLSRRWPIELSFSCINPNGIQPCGHCNKCAERNRAFKAI